MLNTHPVQNTYHLGHRQGLQGEASADNFYENMIFQRMAMKYFKYFHNEALVQR